MSYQSCHDTPMQTPPTSFFAPLASTPRQLELPLNLLPLQPHVPALTPVSYTHLTLPTNREV